MKKKMKGSATAWALLLSVLAPAATLAHGGSEVARPEGQDDKEHHQEHHGEMRESQVTEDEISVAMELLQKEAPQMHKRLSKARDANPETFRHDVQGTVQAWRNPDIRQADLRLYGFKEKAQGAAVVDEALTKDLQEALAVKFEAETAAMETQVSRMQGIITDRRNEKDKLLRKRLRSLLDEIGRRNH